MALRTTPVPPRPEIPLIGRAPVLRQVLDRVEAGGATLLGGAAGIGKTRLADEVARLCAARPGWQVISRHATSTTRQLPLSLFSDLLDDLPARPSAGEAMADAYRALAEILPGGRSLVVVDDANLLDESSALLLQRLIENSATAVILTCRVGERLPEGLNVLLRADRIGAIALESLDDADARQLARTAAQGRLSDAQLDEVFQLAAGLPLFVLALVAHRGAPSVGDAPISSLNELVARTLGQPDPADVDALELIALGEPLELAILDRLCAPSSLERLEAAGLITVRADRRRRAVHVAHPLYAEAVVSTMRPLHQRRQLRRLAEELDRFGGARRDDTLRGVLWRLAAGDAVAADAVLAAAQQSVVRGGLALGEQLVREHLDPTTSVEAAQLLAGITLEQGRPAEAVAICAAAPHDGDPAALTRLAVTWCITSFAYLGDVATARAVVDRFRTLVDLPWRRELDYFDITLSFYSGEVGHAVTLVDGLLAAPDVPERARVWFLLPGVLALATNGRVKDALSEATRVVEAAPGLAGEIVAIEAHAGCVFAYASTLYGDLRGCHELLEERLGVARRDGDLGGQTLLTIVGGYVAMYEGRLALAADRLDVSGNVGGGWELAARAWRVHALALAGRVDEARALLGSVTTIPQFAFHHSLNLYASGEVAAASGDVPGAVKAFEGAADHATAHGAHAFAVLARFRAFGVQPSVGRAERLVEIAPRLDGPVGAALGEAAEAWLDRDPVRVARAIDGLVERGNVVLAAHLRDLRTALLRLVTPSAAAVADAAAEAAAVWQGLRATARPASPALDGAGLTAREFEVVSRAAAGKSDNAIALELDISPRTVHAHLRSSYRKLGVSGRHEL